MVATESAGTALILDGLSESGSPLRDRLAERYRVVEPAIDWSNPTLDWSDPAFDWPASDAAVASAIAATGVERYLLVGVSVGADAALRHALRAPEAVAALVLVSPRAIRPASGGDAGASEPLESRLGDVPCPTLAVFGQDDRSIRVDAASIYRERIPNCNIAFVYAAGHDIAADRLTALVNLVSDYLERRETFIVQNRSSVINP